MMAMVVLAFLVIAIAINSMAYTSRKRRREKLKATRSLWASEEPVRQCYGKKSILAVVTCFASLLLIVACGLVSLLVVQWARHPILATAAFLPLASGAALGAVVAGRNLLRIVRFGSALSWARPALRLDDDCLRYFDLFSVPWGDIRNTRDLEVSMGRGGPRAYVLLFVRGSAADYAEGGKLNRLEVKWAASMLRLAVQSQWPPFPKGDFVVVDAGYLKGVYAPRLKVWIDCIRQSTVNRGSGNSDAHIGGQPPDRNATDELLLTSGCAIDASPSGNHIE